MRRNAFYTVLRRGSLRVLLMAGLAAGLSSLASPLQAALWGNPAPVLQRGDGSLGLLFETGERTLRRVEGPASTVDLEARRFFIQGDYAPMGGLSFFGRVIPFTGRAQFEGVDFHPPLFGGGAGLRISPMSPESHVRVGMSASWDWNYATERHSYNDETAAFFASDTKTRWYRMNWTEGVITAGASARVFSGLEFYGGFSYVRSKVYLYVAGNQTDWVSDQEGGAFAGLTARLGKNWSLDLEGHIGNEKTAALAFSYKLGKDRL